MKNISIKRYILLIAGLFISGLGVAVTKKGELGVSPVSSVANVMNLAFPRLSLGNWLIIWNCLLILGQLLILRKKFRLYQLLQIPLSFLFGYFTDLGTWMITGIDASLYIVRAMCVVIGTAVLGLGISMTVYANIIMNSGEAFVKALSDTAHLDFANVKIAFDVSCVAFSVILSLILFHGNLKGTREGTIFAAVMTGIFVKIFSKIIRKAESAYALHAKRR